MPERYFRYVRAERVAAWQRAGWRRLGWLEHAPNDGQRVAIMEWPRASEPVVPAREHGQVEKDGA